MVQLPIFEMRTFYGLSAENQQQVKDVIREEYAITAKAQPNLRHFAAQYFQLSKPNRDKINTLVATFYRTDRQFPRHYADYNDSTDFGISEIKKAPYLFSERFVAYETALELGLKGELRFKVDCSSRITAEQLQDEMNSAFLAKAVKQKASSKVIGINFSSCQRVTETQIELLQEMLSRCKAELFIDLCGDDTIKLKNPWNAVMTMKRNHDTGETIWQGEKIIIQNFFRQVNSFF